MSFENIIFANLIKNEEYTRKVIPHLQMEYFTEKKDKIIFFLLHKYITKYNKLPSIEAILIDLENKKEIDEELFETIKKEIVEYEVDEQTSLDWLVENTENFCQDKALHNALFKSVEIIGDESGKNEKGIIPELLTKALAVSFDTSIGHDYFEDIEKRYEFYHSEFNRIPFKIQLLNDITKGGLISGTLTVIIGGTGVGKSLIMCDMAAHNLMQGKNVLYITGEMDEEHISERIDANLMDIEINVIVNLSKVEYFKRIERLKAKTVGKLIVKEYPSASAGSAHFRHLIKELKLKKKFVPDIIYIDYINICISSRMKYGANIGSYAYIKSIAEEFRGLAAEFDVPIVSATQFTRSGQHDTDPDLESISESIGLAYTCDLILAAITNEELAEDNQILFKQLKNRYNDMNFHRRFVVGINRSKMKLFDVDEYEQRGVLDSEVSKSEKFITEDIEKEERKSKFKSFI